MPGELDFEKPYAGLDDIKEVFCIFANANMALRYGPFTMPEAGQIMIEANDRKIPMAITMICGKTVDWELAGDLCAVRED